MSERFTVTQSPSSIFSQGKIVLVFFIQIKRKTMGACYNLKGDDIAIFLSDVP